MTPQKGHAEPTEIAAGVYWLPVRGSNVYFVRSGSTWALIDSGWRDTVPMIREAAKSLFGPDSPPESILLTHPHPDHVGGAAELARTWHVPVYIHAADLKLLTGDVASSAESMDPIGRFFHPVASPRDA